MTKKLTLLLVFFLLAACADGASPGGPAAGERSEMVSVTTSLRVVDVRAAALHLRATAERLGGHVAASDLRQDGAFADLRLRVPSAELGALRDALDGLDDGRGESERRRDVTGERADATARLVSARATEARLLALLEDRTATLADVLAVEAELGRASERVAVLEAEDRVAADRVALAEVHVTLALDAPTAFDDPASAVVSAFALGVEGTLAVALGLVLTLTALAPGLFVLVALALLGRALVRHARRPAFA